jgi:dihydrofolate reductase
MDEIAIVVAYDKNRLIGDSKKNGLPWHVWEEMRHFKETTMGQVVIMGRKTWDSLPDRFKPLPARQNIVVSRQYGKYTVEWHRKRDREVGPFFRPNLDSALAFGSRFRGRRRLIIGGAELYQIALASNWVTRIIASEIDGEYEGDVYFPALTAEWKPETEDQREGFKVVEYVREWQPHPALNDWLS